MVIHRADLTRRLFFKVETNQLAPSAARPLMSKTGPVTTGASAAEIQQEPSQEGFSGTMETAGAAPQAPSAARTAARVRSKVFIQGSGP